MTQIVIAAADGLDPSKAYADARWRENPRLSPDGWRLTLGRTTARGWFDGRERVPDYLPLWQAGVNGILVSATTWPAWQDRLAQVERGSVLAVQVAETAAEHLEGVDVVLCRAPDAAGMRLLESAVKEGRLLAYGLAGHGFEIEALEAAAAQAAQEVWGRRKRHGLRALLLQMGPLWMPDPAMQLLEHAAGHDWLVVAEGVTQVALPQGGAAELREDVPPPPPLLGDLAAAEQEVRRALGGWPQRAGEGLFSVVQALAAGVSPFPGRAVWARWRDRVWPPAAADWRGLGGDLAAVKIYLELLQRAAGDEGAALADWGALQWAHRAQRMLRQRVADRYRGLPLEILCASVTASIPGISGVARPWHPEGARRLLELPDMADVARVVACD